MRIENNFTFTPAAVAAVARESTLQVRIAHDANVELRTGDLLSFEELMPHVFVIARRHVHWVAPDYVQIGYLLDLHRPA